MRMTDSAIIVSTTFVVRFVEGSKFFNHLVPCWAQVASCIQAAGNERRDTGIMLFNSGAGKSDELHQGSRKPYGDVSAGPIRRQPPRLRNLPAFIVRPPRRDVLVRVCLCRGCVRRVVWISSPIALQVRHDRCLSSLSVFFVCQWSPPHCDGAVLARARKRSEGLERQRNGTRTHTKER